MYKLSKAYEVSAMRKWLNSEWIDNLIKKYERPSIKSVTINDKKKVTTVVFTDGDVKMVKCSEDDVYNPEMGIVYCIALKYSGMSKTQFKKMIDRLIDNKKRV